jgi:adenosine deaminase
MTQAWLASLPKVELHIHLEGAIPLPTLWQLVQQYGGDSDVTSIADLEQRFTYSDFPHFIATWVWKNRFIRTYADFTVIAEAVARDLASQNIQYVESHYSPTDFARHGLEISEITRAIRTGLDRVPEITVKLIADVVRDSPIERAMRTVETVGELKEYGVIGIGLGGSEQSHPPAPFAPVFAQARQLGLRTTAHAGEAAGAESIWGALRDLQAERIGHAARANEDPVLVEYLRTHHTPLEMCPISNLRTGVYGDITQHPVADFIARGMLVTINTDDPKIVQQHNGR